jgi:hypothetical protein
MKFALAFLLTVIATIPVKCQVLCIQCYDQNNRVSSNVTDFVINGSFEDDTCYGGFSMAICPNSNQYNCDIVDWLCTGGGTGTYANCATANASVDGVRSVYFGNYFCYACNPSLGDTSCFTTLGCTVTGISQNYPESQPGFGDTTGISLSQTVNGLIPGNVYVLEFWVGGEAGFQNDGVFAVDIGFGNTFLTNPMTYPLDTGRRYIIQFLASSSSHTIKFTNWGHICSTCTELILDDVRVYHISQLSSIIPACAVGIISENPESLLNVNVVGKTIHINSLSNYKFRLYNVSGQLLNSLIQSGSDAIDLSGLMNGIYLYEIENAKGIIKNKIVII